MGRGAYACAWAAADLAMLSADMPSHLDSAAASCCFREAKLLLLGPTCLAAVGPAAAELLPAASAVPCQLPAPLTKVMPAMCTHSQSGSCTDQTSDRGFKGIPCNFAALVTLGTDQVCQKAQQHNILPRQTSCAACNALVMYHQKHSMHSCVTLTATSSLQLQPALPNNSHFHLTGDCDSDRANPTAVI